jgi:hypothetical protein
VLVKYLSKSKAISTNDSGLNQTRRSMFSMINAISKNQKDEIMDTYYPLIITTAIFLLPLIPSGIIYLLLTPRSLGRNDEARGEYEGQFLNLGKIKIQFNIFGSSATYVVLLFSAYFIHNDMESDKIQQLSMKDQQAWLVKVPVNLKDAYDEPLQANNQEMQQVMVTLEPGNIDASAISLQFWVVPDKGIFPTANFSMPGARSRETLDLNSTNKISYNHDSRTMESIVPIWFEIGDAYEQ